jgi:hypothetical protein
MKKSSYNILTLLLVFMSSSLLLVSCKATKAPLEPTPIVVNQSTVTDTTKTEVISKAIADKITIPVMVQKSNNRVFDSLVNAKVDEILAKLDYTKQSGDNSLEVKYNALLKKLEIITKIGETNSTKVTAIKIQKIEIPVIQKVPYPVIQPLTKLQKILIALGVGFTGFYGIKLLLYLKSKAA